MSNKVYTKKGDNGTTSLLSGRRVSKLFPEIKAVGALDELNSFIGLLRSEGIDNDWYEKLQWNLFNAGSMIINDCNADIKKISEEDVTDLENQIDDYNSSLPDLKNFIIPVGNRVVSYSHVCRTICRRAEIEVLSCLSVENADKVAIIAKYLNRLSDFFFVLARYLGHKEDIKETIWKN